MLNSCQDYLSTIGGFSHQRKMQKVAKENEFYMQLINEALPSEVNSSGDGTEKTSKGKLLWHQ